MIQNVLELLTILHKQEDLSQKEIYNIILTAKTYKVLH